MAGHMINPSTKFEDPTATRSWVVSSDLGLDHSAHSDDVSVHVRQQMSIGNVDSVHTRFGTRLGTRVGDTVAARQ